jgi:alpha-galactosidase
MNSRLPSLAVAVALALWSQFAAAVAPSRTELGIADRWVAAHFGEGEEAKPLAPFFSFNYGGKPSAELLKSWTLKRETRSLDENRTEHTLTYTDPETKLTVRCVSIVYRDFPNVEWTVYFKNAGDKDTPILSEIQSLDIQVVRKLDEGADGGEFLLHHNAGTTTQPGDYGVRETVLGPGVEKVMTGAGGCPTTTDLSYFNLAMSPSEGMIIAVGWPGQLATRFTRDNANGVRIRAGQELTHFKLLPGEEVRTPLITLQFWKGGDWLRAQNVWRRWFIAHAMRKPGGKLPPTHWTGVTGFGLMDTVNTDQMKLFINGYLERGFKPGVWWIDAGWYPCGGSWPNTGTWEVDKARFPNGLRESTDILHENGIKAVLWFEPERAVATSQLAETHPEWILGGKKGHVVDFGNPDAWKWIVERIDQLIVSEGVDIYRQDFNTSPLAWWRANDAPDRQGIAEIRHVTGLLAYWDELLRRHPNMLYDNCAGGGRRNDLESMKRGVAYCKSDYAVEPVGVQGETYGISLWLPCYGASWGDKVDAYTCRSNMAHLVGVACDVTKKEPERDKQMAKRIEEWRKTTAHFWGDFWPLTPYSLDNKAWIAWQFDEPERGEGVVQAFRRAEAADESATLRLRGLDSNAVYVLMNLDDDGTTEMSGRGLLDTGLRIDIRGKPGAAIITYKKKR